MTCSPVSGRAVVRAMQQRGKAHLTLANSDLDGGARFPTARSCALFINLLVTSHMFIPSRPIIGNTSLLIIAMPVVQLDAGSCVRIHALLDAPTAGQRLVPMMSNIFRYRQPWIDSLSGGHQLSYEKRIGSLVPGQNLRAKMGTSMRSAPSDVNTQNCINQHKVSKDCSNTT
jgi:hypothetical protein